MRVHDDARAAASAEAMGARAYTAGSDIVFGAGRYAPETSAGRRLLAHELTHVVQQTGTHAGSPAAGRIQRAPLPWADRVRNAGTAEQKLVLMNEAVQKASNAALYPGLVLPVQLIRSGSITKGQDGDFVDADPGSRADREVYFDPQFSDRGGRLDVQERGWLGWHPTGGSYVVLGPGALDARADDFTANVLYHEYVHIQQKEGRLHGKLLDQTADKPPRMRQGVREALAHAEDFRAFFGRLHYDPAGADDQPALQSLLIIHQEYWKYLRTVDAARDAVTDRISGAASTAGDKATLRHMLGRNVFSGSPPMLRAEVLAKL